MKGQLINSYIDKLTIQDINNIANKNNINLNDYELNFIYNQIKNNYNDLLYGDSTNIFNELKNNVSSDNYYKIMELYTKYKQRYQSLL